MHPLNHPGKTALSILFAALVLLFASYPAQAQQKIGYAKLPAAPSVDLHTAVATGNIQAVKEHIVAGTDINMKDTYAGSSPLITACLYNQAAIARLLLNEGANINFQNNEGSTALHVAAFFCKTEMVQLLLDKKADKTIRNKYKSTAYESVAGPFTTVKNLYEQMQKMLLPFGVRVDLAYMEKTRPVIAKMLQ
jgi:uncharacterized protein